MTVPDPVPDSVPSSTPAPASRTGPIARVALAAAIVGGLAWALRGVDTSALRERAAALPGWLWTLAALGVLVSHALRAARLHAEWQGRTGARYRDCLQLALLHNAAVVLLPLRSGEVGYPWWLLRRWQVPLRVSVPSLLWLRLQDLLVLGALSALWLLPAPLAASLALALAVVAGLVAWRARARTGIVARQPVDAAPPVPDPSPSTHSTPIRQALAEALRAGRGGLRGWLCAAANWSVRLLAVAALLAGLTGLPIGAALPGALAGEWAAVLPLQAPAGLGTYEAGVWFGLQAAAPGAGAVSPTDALAAALAVHLFWLAIGLLAALPAVSGLAAWRQGAAAPRLGSAPPT